MLGYVFILKKIFVMILYGVMKLIKIMGMVIYNSDRGEIYI